MADNKELEKNKKAEETGSSKLEEKEIRPATVEDKGIIKETTGSEMEIYDEDNTVDLSDSAKPKKKKIRKRWIVLAVAVLLIAFFIVKSIISAKNNIPMVETYEVTRGDIENVLSISGTVESAETKNYFADATAPIETLNVKVGDKVSKGDVLCTFDQAELELSKKKAELALAQAEGSYSSAITKNAKATDKLVGNSIHDINNRIDQIDEEVRALEDQVEEKKTRISKTQDELNRVLMDYNQNGVSDSAENYDQYSKKDEDGNELYLQTQNALKDTSWALSHDEEIKKWQDRIEDLNVEKKKLQEQQSAELGAMTAGDFKSAEAQKETSELTNDDAIAKIEEAIGGVKADFNGVVTNIPATVVEGATVTTGTALFSLANLDDVQITIQVSKSDLPKIAVGQKVDITINGKAYEGEVTKISGTAFKNTNGVAVVSTVIKVTNPDSDIILGVEANNKIHAEKAENTLVLPYEYVQTDSEGDYVYVVENNVVTRKNVTIGIASSTDAQITEGLSEGDKVIASDVSMLTEGMPVSTLDMQ
ncbi:MAG: efflux RND transporter periplasmic adaptor subunit [Butyrivibrio sp.]|nr:efflux RND transporter periplasmic adaptor subunit [Butyrivibrio sp.]